MKAIVMAGGEGRRLRPLTVGRPKPMVELLGKPVLEYTVELLKKNGVTDICFTLQYLPKVIEDYFGSGEALGVKIEHRVEKEPLGTAGSVRACADFAAGEDVLVISGDAVCSFDLKKCMDFHKSSGAEATIVLYEHPEPTEYGLVITDGDGRIIRFVEKPSWDMVTTNRINTGIYILSPSVLNEIPQDRPCDFGKELFPKLLAEGRNLFAVTAEGYWCDIGSPEAYLDCLLSAISGNAGIDIDAEKYGDGIWSKVKLDGVKLRAPAYVGTGCTVAAGAQIGPNSIISDGSGVGRGSVITGSVINGASVGENCRIDGAIIGRGAVICDRCDIGHGCVIGDGAYIGAGCQIAPDVRIWTNRRVEDGSRITRSLIGETPPKAASFCGESVKGVYPLELSVESAVSFGGVLGALGRTGIAHSGGEAARLISDAIGCGVAGAGGECLELDCAFEAELSALCRTFLLKNAVFVRQDGNEITVTFFDGDGLPIGQSLRRSLETALHGEYPRVSGASVGGISHAVGAGRAYISQILDEVAKLIRDTRPPEVAVVGGGAENRVLRETLEALGGHVRGRTEGVPAFSVSRGGFELTAWDERGRKLDPPQMQAVAADAALRLGVDELAVPPDVPDAIEKLSEKYGGRVIRTASGSAAEGIWAKQRFFRDGVLAAAIITMVMSRDNVELSHIYDGIPNFAVATRRVDVACSRAKAMRLLASSMPEAASEIACGLTLDTARGKMRIRPSFDGKALILRGEGENAEIAGELCGDFERMARDVTEKDK